MSVLNRNVVFPALLLTSLAYLILLIWWINILLLTDTQFQPHIYIDPKAKPPHYPNLLWQEYNRQNQASKLSSNNRTTLGFDHIFVVTTISESTERINRTKALMDFAGIDVEYWPAETIKSHLLKIYKLKWDPSLNNREYACFASHMTIYQEIVRKNYRHALILEDDVDFEVDIVARMSRLSSIIPRTDKWDLLYPGYCFRSSEDYETEFEGWYTTDSLYCTHSYAITRGFAYRMLANHVFAEKQIDLVLQAEYKSGNVKRFLTSPQIFAQLPKAIAKSTLGSEIVLENQELKQSAFNYTQRLKYI